MFNIIIDVLVGVLSVFTKWEVSLRNRQYTNRIIEERVLSIFFTTTYYWMYKHNIRTPKITRQTTNSEHELMNNLIQSLEKNEKKTIKLKATKVVPIEPNLITN